MDSQSRPSNANGNPVEPEGDAGFEDADIERAQVRRDLDGEEEEGNELDEMDEFGKRRASAIGESIRADGTRTFLNGWFGLDATSLSASKSSRRSRKAREREIQDSLPQPSHAKVKTQIPTDRPNDQDASSSSEDEFAGFENELGETEEEEYDRLAA